MVGYFSPAGLSSPDKMRDRALELARQFDAFGDNPWAVLYRELDTTFPGSKFILTTRDPDKWYASACKYFGDK